MSEHNHQAIVVDFFKLQYPEYAGCIVAIPNAQSVGGKEAYRVINKLKKEGLKKGASDLFIAVPRRGKHGLWVEMKDAGKTACSVSKEQREHLELMIKMGYEGIWAAGSDIAIAAIKTYMFVRPQVHY